MMDSGALVQGINCTPAAYFEFPTDAFSDEARVRGAIVLHLLVVVYVFIALAVVCDDYFVPSLGHICERMGFSEDVAGATFMAAGSSAPELFTSIIGVFVAKGDVGTGTIVGSAVFNILCIVGLCGVLTVDAIFLSWWPLVRDSFFYSLSVIALIFVIRDGLVEWWEAVIMLALYSLYILIMKYNTELRAWTTAKLGPKMHLPEVTKNAYADVPGEEALARPENLERGYQAAGPTTSRLLSSAEGAREVKALAGDRAGIIGQSLTLLRTPRRQLNIWEVVLLHFVSTRGFRARRRIWALSKLLVIEALFQPSQPASSLRERGCAAKAADSKWASVAGGADGGGEGGAEGPPSGAPQAQLQQTGTSKRKWLLWHLMLPIRFMLAKTIPDSRKTDLAHLYPASFGLSVAWIALLSYVMVWMVTVVGFTLGIPDSIMGITFLAAGTSIPDAMASVIVSQQGQGDMAVSNSVGSNSFDILLGLAFPWFLQTAIVSPGIPARINSNGLVFSVLLLFLTVAALVGGVSLNGWKLDRRLGTACLILYAVFISLSCMIEANVFGFVNPPNCPVM